MLFCWQMNLVFCWTWTIDVVDGLWIKMIFGEWDCTLRIDALFTEVGTLSTATLRSHSFPWPLFIANLPVSILIHYLPIWYPFPAAALTQPLSILSGSQPATDIGAEVRICELSNLCTWCVHNTWNVMIPYYQYTSNMARFWTCIYHRKMHSCELLLPLLSSPLRCRKSMFGKINWK